MSAAPSDLIVIAGGGTAGHALPAIAVARELVARGHDPQSILFVGSARGLEARLVPEAGFSIVLLPGRGIARRVALANVAAIAGLAWATVRALALFLRRRPSSVLSVGGYAAAPSAVAAVVLRVPLVVHEANGVAGAANRLVGRFARAAAVAFPGTGLPREVVTGTPVRPEVLALAGEDRATAKARARQTLGLPEDRFVLAATGGSLGARRINDATLGLAELWTDRSDVAIHHVVGSRDWASVAARVPAPDRPGLMYRAVEYESRMPEVISAADVVLSRAGGTTVAELAVLGAPSILVPLPIAPDDHQTVQAQRLARAGAAIVISDAELTADRLSRELGPLVADAPRRAAMSAAATAVGHPGAAAAVAALLEEHGRGRV